MARVTITYEHLTDASIEAGDVEDNGWVQPGTEKQRSLRKGGARTYERNVRMAQRGRFDWRLRDAVEWLDNNNPGYISEGYADNGHVETEGRVRDVWSLTVRALADGQDIVVGRNGYEHGGRTNYELHLSDASHGTRERLRRVLAKRFNVRFYQG